MLSICVLQENAILVFLLKNVMFNSIWYLWSNIICSQTNIYSIYILNHKYWSDCKNNNHYIFYIHKQITWIIYNLVTKIKKLMSKGWKAAIHDSLLLDSYWAYLHYNMWIIYLHSNLHSSNRVTSLLFQPILCSKWTVKMNEFIDLNQWMKFW